MAIHILYAISPIAIATEGHFTDTH